MLDDIERGDEIERRVVKGDAARGIALPHVIAARARHRDGARVHFDPLHASIAREVVNHIPRAATNVQHVALAPRHIGVEQIQERPGACGKPPVMVFREFSNRCGDTLFSFLT